MTARGSSQRILKLDIVNGDGVGHGRIEGGKRQHEKVSLDNQEYLLMQVLCGCPIDSPQFQACRGGDWRRVEKSPSTTFTLIDSVSA